MQWYAVLKIPLTECKNQCTTAYVITAACALVMWIHECTVYVNDMLNPPFPPTSVQELMQEKEDLSAQLQQVRDEVVELRQQLKAAYEEQKQAEATRDEAEMKALEVHTPHWGKDGGGGGKGVSQCWELGVQGRGVSTTCTHACCRTFHSEVVRTGVQCNAARCV